MLIAEADRRIAASRHVLANWLQNGTEASSLENALAVINVELLALEHIADEHPGKVQDILKLVMRWIHVQDLLKSKLH